VDGDATDVIVALLDLPYMNARTALKAEVTGRAAKLDRSSDGF
jgi:hypothetical protein